MTCKFGIGGALRLTCRCVRIFLQAFTRRHVPRATCRRSTPDRHHRRSGVPRRPSVPPRSRSDQPFGRYSRKCLDTHTHTHTHKHQPPYFFSPTHRRKSSFIRTCYAKALAPSILYDFGLEAGIAKHCLGAKIVDIAIFRFGSGVNFTTKHRDAVGIQNWPIIEISTTQKVLLFIIF